MKKLILAGFVLAAGAMANHYLTTGYEHYEAYVAWKDLQD